MIDANLTTILVGVITCVVSVLATWYFLRRHYRREPTQTPITANDIALQEKRNEFRLFMAVIVAGVVAVIVLLAAGAYCLPIRQDSPSEGDTTQSGGHRRHAGGWPDYPPKLNGTSLREGLNTISTNTYNIYVA